MKPMKSNLFVILIMLLMVNLNPVQAQEGSGTKASEAIKKAVDTKNTSSTKEEELKEKLKDLADEIGKKFPDNADSVKIHFDREARKIRDRKSSAKEGFGVKNNKELVKWINDLLNDLSSRALVATVPGLKDSGLLATAKGTGQTTGNIATLTIRNEKPVPVVADIGPFLIPSNGKDQPYIAPSSTLVNIPPNTTISVTLEGYCADIHSPPVANGEAMPPIDSWIEVSSSGLPADWRPETVRGWQPLASNIPNDIQSIIERPQLLVPGTDLPLNYIIDQNTHPEEAAPVLFEMINLITEAYDNLKEKGEVSTPFSNTPERERESVIQQTFWIAAAALTGTGYKIDDFAKRTEEQFEETTGQKIQKLKPDQKEDLDAGIADFWNTFQAVGVEAKVISALNDIKKKEDFDVWRRKKYDDYAVERDLNNKSHEAACKAIGVDPNSDLGKALRRVYDGEKGKK